MQRRELFSFLSTSIKDVAKEKTIQEEIKAKIRPPYFESMDAFDTQCPQCETKNCATVCQEQIILIAEDGSPTLEFGSSGCTFCDECALACEDDVLQLQHKRNINATVSIDEGSCLSWQGVMCFSCKDPCLEDAIEFKAMFMPHIVEDKCTSCGFCLSRCPALSIKIEGVNVA